MKALSKCLGLLLVSAALASCGGGGGSGSHNAFDPVSSGTLELTASTQQLPLNRSGVGPFFGSPFMSEVTVTWRRANGDLVSGQDINVSINPVSVAGFSQLDDPTTDWTGRTETPPTAEGNEFLEILGSGPVHVEGGHATIFVHSFNQAGTATLTVTAKDPDSPTTISKQLTFTVVSSTPALPATVQISSGVDHVYLTGSGGNTASQVTVLVQDAEGQNVPNPTSGNTAYNNVQLEVLGQTGSGTLTAIDASGSSHTGTVIKTRTLQGIAGATFTAGTIQGSVQIRATTDAADNNVDNGITTPITTVTSLSVSDGKLFSLVITSPTENAILVNYVTGSTAPTNGEVPVEPDGTYSLTISAQGQDRQGNPVLPGTTIRFGAIDGPAFGYPQQGPGTFYLSGLDGNPQEGGTLFTAPTGHFTTAGGGAGPGDTLLVFGQSVVGNSDHESARIVQSVNTATSLNVTVPFNLNDTTGHTVDSGNVLPYVIGRATEGNITASAVTNSVGVASVKLTYPITRLGKLVYVYAQSDTNQPNNGVKTVADIESFVYPGVADAKLLVSPESIPGNSTVQVQICTVDALGAALQGITVAFQFHDLGVGSGKVDGVSTAGVVAAKTGANGCTVATVSTVGIGTTTGGTGNDPGVTFSAIGLSQDVEITAPGSLILIATPNTLPDGGGIVTLRLLDSSGQPVPGAQLIGSCTATGGASVNVTTQPGITDATGKATAVIVASNINQYGGAGSGLCTFTTSTGSPSATVSLTGINLCGLRASPPDPPICSTTPAP